MEHTPCDGHIYRNSTGYVYEGNFPKTSSEKMAADGREEKNRQKWDRIMEKGVDNVLKDQPEAFLRRARRGIPYEYRYALL
jgi:hypothetical protein